MFRGRPAVAADLEQRLAAMLGPTRLEPGCITYDLYRAENEPGVFFFYEIWNSAAAHAAHLETEHVRNLVATTRDLLEVPVHELKARKIGPAVAPI